MNTFFEKTYDLFTKNKPTVVIITLIALASGLYTFWPKSEIQNQQIIDSPISIKTVNQTGGTNIINSDAEATRQVAYYDVAKLNFEGAPFTVSTGLTFNSPLSDLLKPFVTASTTTGQVTFQCTQDALSSYTKIINGLPRFPFSYFYLGSCEKKLGNSNWKSNINTARIILNITTSIPGHDISHDIALSEINKDYPLK